MSAKPNSRSEFTHTQLTTLWKNQSLVPTQQTQGSFSSLVITADKHHTYKKMEMEQRQKHDRKSQKWHKDTNTRYRT